MQNLGRLPDPGSPALGAGPRRADLGPHCRAPEAHWPRRPGSSARARSDRGRAARRLAGAAAGQPVERTGAGRPSAGSRDPGRHGRGPDPQVAADHQRRLSPAAEHGPGRAGGKLEHPARGRVLRPPVPDDRPHRHSRRDRASRECQVHNPRAPWSIESNGGTRRIEVLLERPALNAATAEAVNGAGRLTSSSMPGRSASWSRPSPLTRRLILVPLALVLFRLLVLVAGLIPLGPSGAGRFEPRLGSIALVARRRGRSHWQRCGATRLAIARPAASPAPWPACWPPPSVSR